MIAVIRKMRVSRIIFYTRDLCQDNSTCNALLNVSFFWEGLLFAKSNVRLIQTLDYFSGFVVTGPNHITSETTKPHNRRIDLCKKVYYDRARSSKSETIAFSVFGLQKIGFR